MTEDFLNVDKPLPGQNYACLSFLSPETTLEKKEVFFVKKFLKEKYEILSTTIDSEYDNFLYEKRAELEKEFQEQNSFQTTIRGIKVRGVYDTYKEAENRAKELQQLDPSFHIFIGSVGYWLPWDPSPDAITDSVYAENQLNELMKNYKENEIKRDIMYQQQKEDIKKKALEENESKKQALLLEETEDHETRKQNFSVATLL